MLPRRFFALVLTGVLLLPLTARAVDGVRCDTGVETGAAVDAMHRANPPRAPRLASDGARLDALAHNGMFVIPKMSDNALLDRPNDLQGKSVRFVPAGNGRYAATITALQYDTNVGPQLRQFAVDTSRSDWHYAKVNLAQPLSLFGQPVQTIYVTAFNSITFVPPALDNWSEYDAMEAAMIPSATIAPLLMPYVRPPALSWPAVFVRQSSDVAVVTWRSTGLTFSYDVQATINSGGTITFSYKTLGGVTWGAALITPGASALMNGATTIVQADDAAGDAAAATPQSMRDALDIRSITVTQTPAWSAYSATITLGAEPFRSLPARGDNATLVLRVGDAPPTILSLGWNGSGFIAQPGRIQTNYTRGVIVDRNLVHIVLYGDALPSSTTHAAMVIETALESMNTPVDTASVEIPLTGDWLPGADLSAVAGEELRLPIVEAFTVPAIDLESVWESVRTAGKFTDDEIDGVAVFENFSVEVVLRSVAYATLGNAGDDGVWKYLSKGSSYPRTPNLMQMNVVTPTTSVTNAARLLLHEFGHRWLQFIETMENGTPTVALNPVPVHPPQFASNPAAFPVINSYDTSTMGGGFFHQSGNTFTSSPYSPFGYSWFDLYLMGLAAPEEVPATYVIDGASPALGNAYHPPGSITVTGTRRDLTIQQVIAAMGPRNPSSASSRRAFKIVFVLVVDPSKPWDADLAALDQIRHQFVDIFARATGHRASVQTEFHPSVGKRRRAVQK